MTDLIAFVPKSELDARANMSGFIDLCKTKLTIFGSSLNFDDNAWDVSEFIKHSAKTHRVRLVFSNLETCRKRDYTAMRDPFISFAKAYTRYQHGLSPTVSPGKRMEALRALEAALVETGTSDPVLINSHILNRAAQILHARGAATNAYHTGGQLEKISHFLCDNYLVSTPARWRNPIKRPSDTVRVGREGDERRAAKMPSEAALEALPKIFRLATDPSDLAISSIAAILCAAPNRINEVLNLPVRCEVDQKRHGCAAGSYGLRWWPAKGAAPMVKWVIPSMTEVVKEAIDRVRRLTCEARKVALWYESHPTQIYLSEDTEKFRKKRWLSMAEINEILFLYPADATVPHNWCKANNVPFHFVWEGKKKRAYVDFEDVQAAVIRMLPRGFPDLDEKIGLKYSESLFVILRNAWNSHTTWRCMIERVTHAHTQPRLGESHNRTSQSMFERHGFYEPDGSSIRVRSHQFRHYLNTLAQAGGLSQLDIAKWSGRKDVQQNKYYDHETSTAVVARIRSAIGDDTRMFGPLATSPRAALITRDEFARLKVPTAHTTDFGYCIHDYVMSPCQLHRDCLNCSEQVCVKGEEEKEARIRKLHQEGERLLGLAGQAQADGELGAAQWVEYHEAQLTRVKTLLAILDDPTVPRGAIIQLVPTDGPSRLEQAAQARVLQPARISHGSTSTSGDDV